MQSGVAEEFTIRCPRSEELQWVTSHQLFWDLLKHVDGSQNAVKMAVYDYTVDACCLWRVRRTLPSVGVHWLPAVKPKVVQKKKKLPFGVQRKPKTKRKKQQNKQKIPRKRGRKQMQEDGGLENFVSAMVEEVLGEESGKFGPHSDCDCSDSSSSAGSSELYSSAAGDDGDGDDHDVDALEEEQSAFPEQQGEEAATKEAIASHDELQAEISEKKDGLVSEPAQTVRTQCQPIIGVVDAGQQTSARLATCRYCLAKIGKGRTRVAYSFNVLKFHAWVHASCFHEYIEQQSGDKDQARKFLTDWVQSHPCSSEALEEFQSLISKL